MLAQDNEYINEASATIYQLSQEEKVRLQCEAREDYYRLQRGMQRRMEKLTFEKYKLSSQNQELYSEIQQLSCKNGTLSAEYEKLLLWAKEHGYKD